MKERITHIRRTNENDPLYRERLKSVEAKSTTDEEFIYGAKAIRSWRDFESLRGRINDDSASDFDREQYEKGVNLGAELLPRLKDQEREDFERMNPVGPLFFEYWSIYNSINSNDSYRGKHFSVLLEEVLEDDETCAKILASLEDTFPEHKPFTQISPETVMMLFRRGGIDEDLLVQMLEVHVKKFRQESERFEQMVESYKEEYRDLVFAEIESGYLPTTKERVQKIIEETRIFLKDQLQDSGTQGKQKLFEIEIASGLDAETERHAVFHELTHAISGRAFVKTQFEFENGSFPPKIKQQKSGLYTQKESRVPGKIASEYFRDLNEAVTENIACRLSGAGGSYVQERFDLLRLIHQPKQQKDEDGNVPHWEELVEIIPERLLLEAYFEDYDPEAEGSRKLAKFGELLHTIRDVEGKESLQKRMS